MSYNAGSDAGRGIHNAVRRARLAGAAHWRRSFPGVVSPFNPPFLTSEIVSVGEGGHITLRLSHYAIPQAGGPEIGVFENVGLIDTNFPNGVAGSPAATFGIDSAACRRERQRHELGEPRQRRLRHAREWLHGCDRSICEHRRQRAERFSETICSEISAASTACAIPTPAVPICWICWPARAAASGWISPAPACASRLHSLFRRRRSQCHLALEFRARRRFDRARGVGSAVVPEPATVPVAMLAAILSALSRSAAIVAFAGGSISPIPSQTDSTNAWTR